MKQVQDAYIVAATRTPIGRSHRGFFRNTRPDDLLATILKAALAQGSAAAKASEFVVYPDAPHAFHADYRPSYRQGPAEDGWKRALAWFKAHGVV